MNPETHVHFPWRGPKQMHARALAKALHYKPVLIFQDKEHESREAYSLPADRSEAIARQSSGKSIAFKPVLICQDKDYEPREI
jgi:hypothetical protein